MGEGSGANEQTYGQWWQSTEEMVEAPVAAVEKLGVAALRRAGASDDDARFLLGILDKSIQGDHARGLDRLPAMVRAALRGEIDLHPSIRVLRETPATALVEGGPKAARALVCRAGMDLAIQKARDLGIGWVSVREPAGILTSHVLQAIDAGFVGIAMTQSYPNVAASGGYQPLFGNAPFAVGIPAGKRDPVILDMSLTQSSAAGVMLAALQGQQLPEGFLLDEHGEPTTDPSGFLDAAAFPVMGEFTQDSQQPRSTLVPLGNSHKGYALVFVVGLLTAVLTDTNPPWDASQITGGLPGDGSTRYGSVFMALDPASFLPPDEFRSRVDAFINLVKASPKRSGVDEILYPGEKSQRLKRQRKKVDVFHLPASHYQSLVSLAEELGLDESLPAIRN
jgi:LDH2 family malate/lactate/ureidoglycolate dehydrogenase